MTTERRFKRLALELRRLLSYADVNDTYRRHRERDQKLGRHVLYKLVRNLPSLSVRMDGTKNHGRPHIHCDIGKKKHAATVALDTGEVLAGHDQLQSHHLHEVQEWVQRHKRALMQLWNEMQAGNPVDALICELQAKDDVPMMPSRKRRRRTKKRTRARKK